MQSKHNEFANKQTIKNSLNKLGTVLRARLGVVYGRWDGVGVNKFALLFIRRHKKRKRKLEDGTRRGAAFRGYLTVKYSHRIQQFEYIQVAKYSIRLIRYDTAWHGKNTQDGAAESLV